MKSVGKTHIGQKRSSNQDAFFRVDTSYHSLPNLYIVADGMGGHLAGEIASTKAIEFFINYIENNVLGEVDLLDFFLDATSYAHKGVLNTAKENKDCKGMGTTFTALTIKDNKGYIAHIGDSRIYLINDNIVQILTTDHSYIQEMLRHGSITVEEAKTHPSKNALTRALGVEEDLLIDGYVFNFLSNDKILICTHGLTNMVTDDDIVKIVKSSNNIDAAIETLINTANNNGGADNITIVLVEMAGDNHGA